MQFDAVSLVAFHDYWDPSAQVSARYFVAGTGTCIETPPLAAALLLLHTDLALMMQCAMCARVLTTRLFLWYMHFD